jgi:glycosyltransferase involved in cell wall biosynthesis
MNDCAAMISIVITTYNRLHLVSAAIDSALEFLGSAGDGEIIVVDDHSQDNTYASLKEKYAAEIKRGGVKIARHLENRGVTAAKNTGAATATGAWTLFLDSDDKLIAPSRGAFFEILQNVAESIPIVFFRCLDEKNQPIGSTLDRPVFQDLVDFLKHGTRGESLPVVRTHFFRAAKYREDLRGFEGLSYCKLIKRHGQCMISPLAVRIYSTNGSDRLSNRRSLMKRGCLLAKGYASLLMDHYEDVPFRTRMSIVGKMVLNISRCVTGKLFPWK